MKKWLALLLILCMAFSFAACTDSGYEDVVYEESAAELVKKGLHL